MHTQLGAADVIVEGCADWLCTPRHAAYTAYARWHVSSYMYSMHGFEAGSGPHISLLVVWFWVLRAMRVEWVGRCGCAVRVPVWQRYCQSSGTLCVLGKRWKGCY
jgi:hypothetical protein